MPFSIDEFNTIIGAFNGVQKTNLFSMSMALPGSLGTFYSINDMLNLQFLCMGAFAPSPEIQNAQVRRYGYGLQEDMPFNAAFTPRTFTFIGDGDGYILNFFRDWQRSIIEYSSENDINRQAVNNPNISTPTAGAPILPYFVRYKNGPAGYATAITVDSYQPTGIGFVMDRVILMEAFPINVEDVRLNWEFQDLLTTIEVTISFRDVMYDSTTRPQEKALVNNATVIGPAPSLFATLSSSITNTAAKLSLLIF